jgi:hypothetical protein
VDDSKGLIPFHSGYNRAATTRPASSSQVGHQTLVQQSKATHCAA